MTPPLSGRGTTYLDQVHMPLLEQPDLAAPEATLPILDVLLECLSALMRPCDEVPIPHCCCSSICFVGH